MKQNKIQVIGSFVVITILIIMMIYVGIGEVFHLMIKFNISNDYINKIYEFENVSSIDIDFEKLYPFQNNTTRDSKEKNIVEKYKETVKLVKEKLDRRTSEKLIGYEKLIECSYIYNDLISYKLVSNSDSNTRIELEEGYFTRLVPKRNITECSNKLIEFNDYLKNQNIDLLYVQAPYKISRTQKISSIYQDYSNENMDHLLNNIKGKVDYIDLRENINESKINHLQLFYKTDHHWLAETGLWATREISNYLNHDYNMNLKIDNVNSENYNIEKYKRIFLGSDGRYVSLKNAALEDLSLITPKFETKLSVKIPDRGIDKTDTFENTLIDWSQLEKEDYYHVNVYGAYVYGNRPLIEIHNEFIQNQKKILLIRDSFCNVVAPFLSLENEYLSVIDLREFNGSLKTYINQFKPDLVIVMYYGDDVEDRTNMWNFK